MAGAIDLFGGTNSLSGVNLFRVDKSPLDQLDQSIVSMVEQLDVVADALLNIVQQLINAILDTVGQSLGDLAEFFKDLGGLLGKLGGITGLTLNEGLEPFLRSVFEKIEQLFPALSFFTAWKGQHNDRTATGFLQYFVNPAFKLGSDLLELFGGLWGLEFTEDVDAFVASLLTKVNDLTGIDLSGLFRSAEELLSSVFNPNLLGLFAAVKDVTDETWDLLIGLLKAFGLLPPDSAGVEYAGVWELLQGLLQQFGLLPLGPFVDSPLELIFGLFQQVGFQFGEGGTAADLIIGLLGGLSGFSTDGAAIIIGLFKATGLLGSEFEGSSLWDILIGLLQQWGLLPATEAPMDAAGVFWGFVSRLIENTAGAGQAVLVQLLQKLTLLPSDFAGTTLLGILEGILEQFEAATNVQAVLTALGLLPDPFPEGGDLFLELFKQLTGDTASLLYQVITGLAAPATDALFTVLTALGLLPDDYVAGQNLFLGLLEKLTGTTTSVLYKVISGLSGLTVNATDALIAVLKALSLLEENWAVQRPIPPQPAELLQIVTAVLTRAGFMSSGKIVDTFFTAGVTALQILGDAAGNVVTLFKNLRTFFGDGLQTTEKAFITLLNELITKINEQVNTTLLDIKRLGDGGVQLVQQLVFQITGATGQATLATIRNFLTGGLTGPGTLQAFNPGNPAATSLLGQLITPITGLTFGTTAGLPQLGNLFTNLRNVFNITATDFANAATTVGAIISSLVSNIAASATTLSLTALMQKLDETLSGYAYQLWIAVIQALYGVPFVGPFIATTLTQALEAAKNLSVGYIGSGGNLVNDPGIEFPSFWPDTVPPSEGNGYDRTRVANATLASPAQGTSARSGSHSLRVTAASTDRFFYFIVDNRGYRLRPRTYNTTTPSSPITGARGVVVRPGEQYYVGCFVKNGTVAATGTVTLLVTLNNSKTGASLSQSGDVNLATATRDSEGWSLVAANLVVPNTGYDRAEFGFWLRPGQVTAGHNFFVDDLVVKETNLANRILPGSITTSLIGTGASGITTANLAPTFLLPGTSIATGNSGINSSNIAPGAVTPDKLPAGQLPADKFAPSTFVTIGQNVNPSQNAGVQISRRSNVNAEGNVGLTKIPQGFFTHIDISSNDIEVLGASNAVITGTGRIENLLGIFRAVTAGWYMVELAYYIKPLVSLGGRIAPLIFRSNSFPTIPTTAYKHGTDILLPNLGFLGGRFVHSSFNIYLPAGGAVQAGFNGEGAAWALFGANAAAFSWSGTDVTANLEGTLNYFSMTLINKTL